MRILISGGVKLRSTSEELIGRNLEKESLRPAFIDILPSRSLSFYKFEGNEQGIYSPREMHQSVPLFEPTTRVLQRERNEFLPRLRDSYANSVHSKVGTSVAGECGFSLEIFSRALARFRHFATSRPPAICHGNPQRLPIIPNDPRSVNDYARGYLFRDVQG